MDIVQEDERTTTYREMFDFLRSRGLSSEGFKPTSVENKTLLRNFLRKKFGSSYENNEETINKKIINFCNVLNRKWRASRGSKHNFLNKNADWLNTNYSVLPLIKKGSGRPKKSFAECSKRHQSRIAQQISSQFSDIELMRATQHALWTAGKHAASDIVKMAQLSPKRSVHIKNAYRKSLQNRSIQKYTPEEAVAFIVDNKLSKGNYLNIRKGALQRGVNLYPSYIKILEAKKLCYPTNIIVEETGASIPLQDLLDHTAHRLLSTIKIMPTVEQSVHNNFYAEFIIKWGCDGSSNHSEYQQKFSDENSCISDSNLFLFSLVPLRLTIKEGENNFIIWQNERPGSIVYCRPIKFMYKRETAEITRTEVDALETEISQLTAFKGLIGTKNIEINYKLLCTMVDGKVINNLTKSSSQSCYLCKCTPKAMNNLEMIDDFEIISQHLKFGISTLHAWIRFLEFVLHVSYKLDIQKATVRSLTEEEKNNLQQRKIHIQKRLWMEVGIKVDKVVQGKGTSNTGNVARKFFQNFQRVAEITGFNEELLKRFYIILTVIASGKVIREDNFQKFAKDTAKLYVHLYDWYPMTPTVHKVLIHGPIIIRYALLPVGMLTEEAQESRNKDYVYIREHHTRKTARVDTNRDLIHTLLVSSDPVIASKRNIKLTKHLSLPKDATNLIIQSDSENDSDTDEEDSDKENTIEETEAQNVVNV